MYDYMLHTIQSGYISELNDKVEAQQKEIDELKANVERLAQWVLFLATNGKEIQCQTTPNNASSQQSIT
jgi:uncharacterized coiled-coil protein SlyX